MKFATLFAAFVSLVAANFDGSTGRNGPVPKAVDAVLVDQTLVLDADWTNFLFTNVGVPVVPNFIVNTPATATVLQVTDLYCSGDIFVIANNGVLFSFTSVPFGVDCQLSTTNATLALEVPYWSSGTFALVPLTTYNFTIIPEQSPWSAGQAAIRWITILI